MPENKIIIETYGELAEALGNCSTSWAGKLWRRFSFKLSHRLSKKGRIRMTADEFAKFKKKLGK